MKSIPKKHYRVARREIFEDPADGLYVTKEEQREICLVTLSLFLLAFLAILILAIKKSK